jgi:hypothetical protein
MVRRHKSGWNSLAIADIWRNESYEELIAGYEEVGQMLGSMIANPDKFKPLSLWLAFCLSAFLPSDSAFCLDSTYP